MPLVRLRKIPVLIFCLVLLVSLSTTNADQPRPGSGAQPSGLYTSENEINFNVLDGASFDPTEGRITLFGHRSSHYSGPRIPYLQHLAVLLDEPRPEFSLEWTAETHQKIADLFRRTRASDWIQTLDRQDHVTRVGAYVLQALGAYPTRNRQAPGYLGLQMEAGPPGSNTIRITAVDSGSPAATAGIKTGQTITAIPDAPLLEVPVVEHSIRFAGSGSTFTICVQGNSDCYKLVLGAASGDIWTQMSRHDVSADVFRAAGQVNAAQAMDALALWDRASGWETAVQGMYEVLGARTEYESTQAAVRAGNLDRVAAMQRMLRFLCVRLEQAFAMNGQLTAAYDTRMAQSGNPTAAFNAAINLLPRTEVLQEQRALIQLGKPGGVQIPQELVQPAAGFRFEVVPKFIRLRPDSLLARVMEDSDYIGKTIINNAELSKKFPVYQTEQEFEAIHPESTRPEGESHVWISVHYVDAAQSADHSTLLVRGIKMRFNIRDIGPNGKDLPRLRDGYENLLTSLYDDLSTEYPVLHELSEASKLSLIAEWVHSQSPDFRLPAEGQVSWAGPQKLPGYVFFYVEPRIEGDSAKISGSILPTGGVALSPFPRGNTQFMLKDIVGTDSSIPKFPANPNRGKGGQVESVEYGGNKVQSIWINAETAGAASSLQGETKIGRMRIQLQRGGTTMSGDNARQNTDPPGVLKATMVELAEGIPRRARVWSVFPNRLLPQLQAAVDNIEGKIRSSSMICGYHLYFIQEKISDRDGAWRVDVDNLAGCNLRE